MPLLLTAALLLTASCGSSRKLSEEQLAEQARIAALVNDRLDGRQYRIYVDYMMPRRGSGQSIIDPYCITVDGDKINSYLPYIGVAYSVPYGGGKALNFEDDIDQYAEKAGRKGTRSIVFSTDNGEDLIVYYIDVYEGGRADITVRCRNRDDISYRGNLDPDSYPKQGK